MRLSASEELTAAEEQFAGMNRAVSKNLSKNTKVFVSFWSFIRADVNPADTAVRITAFSRNISSVQSQHGCRNQGLLVNMSSEDLSAWRRFGRIGRCNPSEEWWDLGEHPGGKSQAQLPAVLICFFVWQLQIELDWELFSERCYKQTENVILQRLGSERADPAEM